MVRNEEVIQFFNHVENTFPVIEWKINDIDIWPLVRILNGFELTTQQDSSVVVNTQEDVPSVQVLSSLCSSQKSIDALFVFDPVIRVLLGDSWYHRLVDPIIENLEKEKLSVVSIEHYDNKICRSPVKGDVYSIYNQMLQIRSTYVLKNYNIHLPEFSLFITYFKSNFEKETPFLSIASLLNIVTYIEELSSIFQLIIQKHHVKSIFMVNFYQPTSFALSLAGHRLGIPTVDIQHGNYSPFIYGNWNEVPRSGYNILPSHFWCWGSADVRMLEKWNSDLHKHYVLKGGNPWISMWTDEEHPLVKLYDQQVRSILKEENVNILFSLQPTYGLIGWEENIPDWVIEAIETSPSNYKWFVRFHHYMISAAVNEKVTTTEKLQKLINIGKVEVEFATSLPLLALLRRTDIHMTAFSTSVIEAQALGVPSIVLHEKAKELFSHQINNRCVIEAYSASELIVGVKTQLQLSRDEVRTKSDIFNSKADEIFSSIAELKVNETTNPSKINYLTETKICMADEDYETVIKLYETNQIGALGLYAGKAYERTGLFERSLQCYKDYIDFFNNNDNGEALFVNGILDLREKFLVQNELEYVEKLNFITLRFLESNFYSYGVFLRRIFELGQYDEIFIYGQENSIDYLFYAGRSYICIKEYDKAKDLLQKYVDIYPNIDVSNSHVTLTKPHKASACFYLGELYFHSENLFLARVYLEECNSFYNGGHRKANEYLSAIKDLQVD